MIRVARRAAASILLALALTTLVGTAALAANPSPTPNAPVSKPPVSKVVQYRGTGITTNPSHPEYAKNADAYAIGLLGFFVVLMPKPFSWATVGLSIWTWAGIYLAYAIVAVVLWLVITRPWKKGDDETIPVSSDVGNVQSPDAAAGA